jgi:hypothetical protein
MTIRLTSEAIYSPIRVRRSRGPCHGGVRVTRNGCCVARASRASRSTAARQRAVVHRTPNYRLRRGPRLLVQRLDSINRDEEEDLHEISQRFTKVPVHRTQTLGGKLRRGQDVPGSVPIGWRSSLTICPGDIDQNEPLGSERAKRSLKK